MVKNKEKLFKNLGINVIDALKIMWAGYLNSIHFTSIFHIKPEVL